MHSLINFTTELMENENGNELYLLPSWNNLINPQKNLSLNPNHNLRLNREHNPDIHPKKNKKWKDNQWTLFRELAIWEYLTDQQKEKCKSHLTSLKF